MRARNTRSRSSCMCKPQSEQTRSADANPDRKPRSGNMLHLLRQFARDKSGSYMVMAAVAMPVLIGAAALGTEAGYWMHQQQKMQDAADSAAFATATYYGPNPNGGLSSQANAVAGTYGFTTGGLSATSATIGVYEPPADGPSKGRVGAVEVKISRSYPRMLSALFGQTPVVIAARAVA